MRPSTESKVLITFDKILVRLSKTFVRMVESSQSSHRVQQSRGCGIAGTWRSRWG